MLVTRASLIPFTVGCACLGCLTLCAEPPAAQPAAPAGIPQRYFMDYPIAGRFCQPIRTALAGAARTSVAGRRGSLRQHPNGGYGLKMLRIANRDYFHTGADFGWLQEGTPVFAIADGVVRASVGGVVSQSANGGKRKRVNAKLPSQWGNLIVIEHRLSEDQCFTTIYGHLANDRHVQIGDFVTAGQLIGSIGRKSAVINGGYEPHLHFGVRAGRFLSRGATLFSVPINGQQTFVRLGTAAETQMTLELPPGLPDMWGVSLSGTNIAVRRIDGAFRMPAWVLWDHMPPEANIVGYSPTLKGWYDPIAFLRQHQAHTNPAPYMSPTLDRKAGKRKHVVDRQAADWKVNEWIRPPSESARDVADLKGKTVCLVCVQAACRASSTHALPMVTALSKQYAADDSVQIVVVQTAFRDFRRNSLANAKRLAKSLPDTVAVGHTGDSKHRPAVLDNYGIAGTPWVVIIDASGKVAFSAVHLRAEQVGRIIDGLKQPKTELTDADAPLRSE